MTILQARIIRALKYSSRLGFELDKNTLKLQEEYLKNINYDMCYKRVKQEFKKTFDACKDGAFQKFVEQGIYKLIAPKMIKFDVSKLSKLMNIYPPKHPWFVYIGLVVIDEDFDKLELTRSEREVLESAKSLLSKKFSDDFELYKAFAPKNLKH